MQNIYLVGFMGSGKSTIGKKISEKLNLKFLDTDKIIEKKNSMTINQIFYNQGEKYFRNEEKKLLIELNKYKKTIISTGGGFVCNSRIIDLINKNNFTIYLKYKSETLYKRLLKEKQNRPLLKNLKESDLKKFIENLLFSREKYYNKSKIIIECKEINENEILREIYSTISIR